MALDVFNHFPSFYMGEHDRITIDGWAARFAGSSGNNMEYMDADDPAITEVFTIGDINRMNAAGKIKHERSFFLHKLENAASLRDFDEESVRDLDEKHQGRVDGRFALVRAYFDEREAGRLKVNDKAIADAMPRLRLLAEEYLVDELPDPEVAELDKQRKPGAGPKSKSMGMVKIPASCSPRALRGWASEFKKHGKKGLIDNVSKQGNINSYYSAEETALMMQVVRDSYLIMGHPPLAKALRDLRMVFATENAKRHEEGRPLLRTPGRDALSGVIKRLDKFFVRVKRYGAKDAMRKMRAVKMGLTHSRPLERVEMDEWKIDLFTIMVQCGLFELFSAKELENLGLLDRTRRWWLVVAIDCRTRVILGMVLTANPKASGAIRCLKMVVSDKGDVANGAGAKSPWHHFGKPETLPTDNGAAFKSKAFVNTCSDLGIHSLLTIGGSPSMRGTIERVFRTASTMLLPDLSGQSFSNSAEKGDYDG